MNPRPQYYTQLDRETLAVVIELEAAILGDTSFRLAQNTGYHSYLKKCNLIKVMEPYKIG